MSAANALRLCLIFAFLIGIAALLRERVGGPLIGAATAIDGDSLRVAETDIRLSGIDAPEFKQDCGPQQKPVPCGQIARRFLQDLLKSGLVTCQIEGIDRFDRSLAQCRIAETDLAGAIVSAGHAIATDGYFREEIQARNAKRGIWAGPFMIPAEWRKLNPR
jgi:endonuclease YncB( thermonuclease family)